MIRFPRSAIALAIAAGAGIVGITLSLPASSASTAVPRMTATQLANGVLFSQGKAAPYLFVLGRPKVVMSKHVRALERLVDHALAAKPALAGLFATDVQSGNRVKVQAGLVILARLTTHASTAVFGRSTTQKAVTLATDLLGTPVLSPAAQDAGGSGGGGTFMYKDGYRTFIYKNGKKVTGPDELNLIAVWVPALASAVGAGHGIRGNLPSERVINLVATSLQAAK